MAEMNASKGKTTEDFNEHIAEDSPLLLPSTRKPDAWPGKTDFDGVHWTKRPSVGWLLPAYFIFALAFGGIVVPKLNFILALVCRDYLSDRQTQEPSFSYVPPSTLGENPQCRIPEVQAKVTEFTLYMSLISGVLSAITCPKIGALSDRYGRTSILALLTSGGLANEVVTILAARYPEIVSYRWLLLGAVFDGICGSFISGMAVTHAYAADCVAPAKRAVAFGYFHACLFTGIAIGPLIAAFLYKATGDLLTIFYIALACHTTFILYLAFVVPESLSKERQDKAKQQHSKEVSKRESCGQRFKVDLNLLAPLKTFYPTGPGSSAILRRNLVLLAAVDTTIFGIAIGAGTVVIYYSAFKFGWGPFETNLFVSITSTTRGMALIVIIPTLTYVFRTRVRRNARKATGIHVLQKNTGSDNLDLWTVRCSIITEVLGFACYAAAASGEVFTLGGVLAAFGGIGSPTLQSALTKHVPHDRTGQLLGATGLLHSLARILCPLITSLIYAKTVNKFPQTIFVVLSFGFAIAFAMACAIKPHVYLDEQDDEESAVSETSPLVTHTVEEEIVGI